MGRKCIIKKRESSHEGLESKGKVLHLQTISQSVRSKMTDTTRRRTLKLIVAELAKKGCSSTSGSAGSNMQVS